MGARIEETHGLASQAATKEDMKKLAEGTATKKEVEAIATAQTTDIVKSFEGLAKRNPTVRNLLIALAALLFLGMNAAQNYLTRPAPVIIPPAQIQVNK